MVQPTNKTDDKVKIDASQDKTGAKTLMSMCVSFMQGGISRDTFIANLKSFHDGYVRNWGPLPPLVVEASKYVQSIWDEVPINPVVEPSKDSNPNPVPEHTTEEIRNARKVMREAFETHPDFKQTYIANVAMVIYDTLLLKPMPLGDFEEMTFRNAAAEKIIDRIFSE